MREPGQIDGARAAHERSDGYAALGTGMTLVAAMAIQNAAHRVHFANAPPSTIMTGTTTQLMMDLADVIHGLAPDKAKATHERLGDDGECFGLCHGLCTGCASVRVV